MGEKVIFAKRNMITIMFFAVMVAPVSEAKLKTVWDVDDYIQDGLIANYDGIRNAGKDKPHESEKEEWVDLVSGSTAKLVKIESDLGYGEWTWSGYNFKGCSYFQTSVKVALGNEFTVQLVTDTDMSRIDAKHQYPGIWACGEFSIYLTHTSDENVAKKNVSWKEDSYTDKNQTDKNSRRPVFKWDSKYVNAAFDAGYSYMVQTPYWINQEKNRFERKDPVAVPTQNYTWGGRKSGEAADNCSRGIIHAWRAYSRKLTDEELAWNRQVDEIRFRGVNMPPITNVVVEVDSSGANGAEPAGVYVVDGEHTFTAGRVTVGGKTYQAVGCQIAEWDEEAQEWGAAVSFDGASYTYTVTETSPKVRLAWIWKFTDGVERVDARHYIQDGLIANYDGILNMGMDKPHGSEKAEWVDLVGGGTATLLRTDTTQDPGEWTESGYMFKGYSYFRTSDEIELGDEFTVQLATDMYLAHIDDEHDYPNIWAESGEFCIYLNRSEETYIAATNLYFKEDLNTGDGSRPYFDWKGKYINAAFHEGYSYMTETVNWISGKHYSIKHGATTPVAAQKCLWGGRTSSRYCSRGVIHAWRAYSRRLTEDELAWNRDIDEIRYRNALPVVISNAVAVVSSKNGFEANEEGVYLLTGSYAFTANRKKDDGVTYMPKFDVESWDGKVGDWKVTVSGTGEECVLRQPDSTVPRRIVWKWFKEGFSVIVR